MTKRKQINNLIYHGNWEDMKTETGINLRDLFTDLNFNRTIWRLKSKLEDELNNITTNL